MLNADPSLRYLCNSLSLLNGFRNLLQEESDILSLLPSLWSVWFRCRAPRRIVHLTLDSFAFPQWPSQSWGSALWLLLAESDMLGLLRFHLLGKGAEEGKYCEKCQWLCWMAAALSLMFRQTSGQTKWVLTRCWFTLIGSNLDSLSGKCLLVASSTHLL